MKKTDWYIISGMAVMGIVPDIYNYDLPFIVQFLICWAGVMVALYLTEKGFKARYDTSSIT